MTKAQFEREKYYQAAMSLARKMFSAGILTPSDVGVIDTIMRAKYRPLFGSLYPLKPLLYKENRGNIQDAKGGMK